MPKNETKRGRTGLADDIRTAWAATDKRMLAMQVLVCLAPLVAGIALYGSLPDPMATHWGFDNQPNGWMPRLVAVVMLPVMMALMQVVCVISCEMAISSARKGDDGRRLPRKFLAVAYWVIPVIAVVLCAATLAYNLGQPISIGKVACGLLGMTFVVLGNYSKKVPYSYASVMTHPAPKSERGWLRMARIMAYGMVAVGLGLLVATFFV